MKLQWSLYLEAPFRSTLHVVKHIFGSFTQVIKSDFVGDLFDVKPLTRITELCFEIVLQSIQEFQSIHATTKRYQTNGISFE